MLDLGQWGEANGLGNALRVGNDPDVQARLSGVLCDPNAREILTDANYMATQHVPWDVHGPGGMGVETIRMNPDNTIDLLNRETGSVANCGKMLELPQLDLATDLGNALRVGNDPDVQAQLSRVVADPDARQIIADANFIATTHAPWDVHGPDGLGVEMLLINANNDVALLNRETGSTTNIAKLR